MASTTVTDRIAMKHGAGGRSMRMLIEQMLLDRESAVAAAMDDAQLLAEWTGIR